MKPDRANDVDHFFHLCFFDSFCCVFSQYFFPFACCGFFHSAKQRTDEKNRHGDDGGRVTTIDARRWHTGGFCTMKQVYKQPSVCVLYILFIYLYLIGFPCQVVVVRARIFATILFRWFAKHVLGVR